MGYEQTEHELNVTLERDLNVLTGRYILRRAREVERVRIDCSGASLIDSEGVIVLYQLVKSGKAVTLHHPPAIFFEVVETLQLSDFFDMDAMVA